MEENKKEQDTPKQGKVFEICYFKVPVNIIEKDGEKLASFQEVDHKDKCFKKEEVTFTSSDEAIAESQKLSDNNQKTLKIAAKMNQDGDLITRMTLCNEGDVSINEELTK
jgi:hypothetical protein